MVLKPFMIGKIYTAKAPMTVMKRIGFAPRPNHIMAKGRREIPGMGPSTDKKVSRIVRKVLERAAKEHVAREIQEEIAKPVSNSRKLLPTEARTKLLCSMA